MLLVGSLGFSLIFNVVWAMREWSLSPERLLSVLAAAACTLIVPAGLHLWPQVPARTWLTRVLRALVMTGICGAAAVTSFSHSVDVLLAAGWTLWTACSVTGGAELLIALSTMALRPAGQAERTVAAEEPSTPVRVQPRSPYTPAAPTTGQAVQPPRTYPVPAPDTLPVPTPEPSERPLSVGPHRLSVVDPDRLADLREWVSVLGDVPTEYAVRKRFRCRQSVAARLLDELAEDDGAAEQDRAV